MTDKKPLRIYREPEANLLHLQDCVIAILGYGNLGRPVALNLRDSGVKVIVGNQEDHYAAAARQDKFEVVDIPNAIHRANVLFMLIPDEVMPEVYLTQILPYLKPDDLMVFASAYNVAFELIEPPRFVNVGLLAPRTLATHIRQGYLSNEGFVSFIYLRDKENVKAMDRLLALALALGALKRSAFEVSFEQEVVLDLFIQQAILPAIHSYLLMASQLLIEKGYPEEAVLNELYLSGELGQFFGQAAQLGIGQMFDNLAVTAQYGILTRSERFRQSKAVSNMESILEAIRNGHFTQEWASEYADGYPRLSRMRKQFGDSLLWRLEQGILERMQLDIEI